jgi:hypothetical protein
MRQETFSTALGGCTWRLRFISAERGVYWQPLATFTAHISQTYRDASGALVYRINGQTSAYRGGHRFSFDIEVRRFNNHRAFDRALIRSAGSGAIVWVGCGAALRRSILANSATIASKAGGVLIQEF